MTVLWVTWAIGALVTWRWAVAYVTWMDMYPGREPARADFVLGLIGGTLITVMAWPGFVLCKASYVLVMKYIPKKPALTWFPRPKPVETRDERKQRLEWERSEARRERERAINTRERELGLELTTWR